MTLEQIKNRQEQINGLLYTLLSDTSVVVERIVGAQPEKEEENTSIKGYPVSGLLEEINSTQNTTETYIQNISGYISLLARGTFAPEEMVECAVKSR